MQLYAVSIPELSAVWVQLLISRYELADRLRAAFDTPDAEARRQLAGVFHVHRQHAAALRHRCAALVPRH